MQELIHAGQLKSFHAFQKWGESGDYAEIIRPWMEPQWFAWLIFLLRAEIDDPELFPFGKWATLQQMEEMLNQRAKEEIYMRAQSDREKESRKP